MTSMVRFVTICHKFISVYNKLDIDTPLLIGDVVAKHKDTDHEWARIR